MDEPNQETKPTAAVKRSRGFSGYFVWLFVIIVVYMLSFGPVVLLWEKRILSPATEGALRIIYAPWEWVLWHTPLYRPLGMYMHLWCPDTFGRDGRVNGRDR